MGGVNSQFIIYTFIIILGYIIKRVNLISEEESKVLVKLVLNVTVPALIFYSLSSSPFEIHLALLTLISFSCGLFMSALGVFLFRHEPGKNRGMQSMMMPGFNGLIAISFVQGILGAEGMRYVAMFDLGVTFTIFLLVEMIASYFSAEEGFEIAPKKIALQLLKSVPLVAAVSALFINMLAFSVPGIIMNFCHGLAQANTPLTLLLMGLFLNFNIDKGYIAKALRLLGIRYGLGLAAGALVYFLLPFEPLFREIIMLYLVLPPPFISLAFALKYKYDYSFAALTLNIANVVTYPLLWMVFKLFE